MKSNILVLGGSGKTGRRIVDRLNRLGHTVLLAQHQSTTHRKTGVSIQNNIE